MGILPYNHFEVLTIPFLVFGRTGSVYSLCGEVECSAKLMQLLPNREPRMGLFYIRLRSEFRGEVCDYCGLFNQEVRGYRCAGCKTKVYCGIECYRMDTVHHTLCEKGDTRKGKGDMISEWRRVENYMYGVRKSCLLPLL